MNQLIMEYRDIIELEKRSISQIERLGLQKERQLMELFPSAISDNQLKIGLEIEKLRKQSDPKKKELLQRIYIESESEGENDKMIELNKEYRDVQMLMQKVEAFQKYLTTRLLSVEADRCVEYWGKHEVTIDGCVHKICQRCKAVLLDSLDHSYLNKKLRQEYEAYERLPAPNFYQAISK